jgi:hypothetical protein
LGKKGIHLDKVENDKVGKDRVLRKQVAMRHKKAPLLYIHKNKGARYTKAIKLFVYL